MTKYVLPVRVYLEDTDAQGVVYNASYFRFMERARTECLRAQGIDHDQLREEHGVVLVLAGIEARFRAPARLSDMLYVSADVAEARGARMRFAQHVRRNGSRRRPRLRGLRRSGLHGRSRRAAAAFSRSVNERVDSMNNDLSIIRLVLDASPFVQAILALLLLASISSWAVIIDKQPRVEEGDRRRAGVRDELLVGRRSELAVPRHGAGRCHAARHGRHLRGRLSRIRQAQAERAWARSKSSKESRRAMRVSQLREMDRLEHNLAFLATVSNTSPYIGLFGTVWGIMSSFQALGDMQSATIAMVAPGISEALDRDGDGPRSRRSRPASSSTVTRIRSAASRCATTRSWRSCRRSSSATRRGAIRRTRGAGAVTRPSSPRSRREHER